MTMVPVPVLPQPARAGAKPRAAVRALLLATVACLLAAPVAVEGYLDMPGSVGGKIVRRSGFTSSTGMKSAPSLKFASRTGSFRSMYSHTSFDRSQPSTIKLNSVSPFSFVEAAVRPAALAEQTGILPSRTLGEAIPRFLKNVWDFSRPHTVIGTFLSISTVFLFAVPGEKRASPEFWENLTSSLLPSLLVNLYITGLNQLTDVSIDKLNKPYLPVASGELSMSTGIGLVVGSLATALWMSRNAAWPLQLALISASFIGTIYSLPPFRLKRFPVLAALCILVVRGAIVNIGYYLHAKMAVLGYDIPNVATGLAWFPEIIPVTLFFAVFGCVIALMKDIPDITGDAIHNIHSFSVRYGPEAMFRYAVIC
jgi:homogentisate phytyltransferase/homogentisate geranylgeranyltransferase